MSFTYLLYKSSDGDKLHIVKLQPKSKVERQKSKVKSQKTRSWLCFHRHNDNDNLTKKGYLQAT